MSNPTQLPNVASLEAILTGLNPASADWRDVRSIIHPDGSRIGELRPWMMSELAKENDDLRALWTRLKESELQITEWRGAGAFVFAPTGPGAADYIQITLGREIEWRAGPVVDPRWPPHDVEELCDPSIQRDNPSPDDRLTGPVYRLLDRAGAAVVHARSFLDRCARVERQKREAKRPEMERRVMREVGPDGTQETPFLELVPDWFDYVPREVRFFQDWSDSSASSHRVFAHWALDLHDYTHNGERDIGFIPRPLKEPKERVRATKDVSIHMLMDRIEAVDREIGLPFGWFFLMTHGHWVDPDVGLAIAKGLRAQRVRLPDRDAAVLLRWADRTSGF